MPYVDYLFLTALDEEWNSTTAILCPHLNKDMICHSDDSISYWLWTETPVRHQHPGEKYLIAGASMSNGTGGQINAGVLCSNSIRMWKPSRIVLTGIAGSLESESLLLGDVIVPDQVFGYEVGDAYSDHIEFRKTIDQTSFLDLDRVRAFLATPDLYQPWQEECYQAAGELDLLSKLDGRRPQLHIGSIASGEFVVKSTAFGKMLKHQISNKIKAVEMEARGLYIAMHQSGHRNDALMIRGISDYADEDKSKLEVESKDMWRKFAAQNTARLLKALWNERPFSPISPDYVLNFKMGLPSDFRSEGIPRIDFSHTGSQSISFPDLMTRRTPHPPITVDVTWTASSGRDLNSKGMCLSTSDNEVEIINGKLISKNSMRFKIDASETGSSWRMLLSFSEQISSLQVTCADKFQRVFNHPINLY